MHTPSVFHSKICLVSRHYTHFYNKTSNLQNKNNFDIVTVKMANDCIIIVLS